MANKSKTPVQRTGWQKVLFDNRFSFLAFFCAALIMALVYYCFDLAPFGDVTILRMDLYHQYGPLFAELYERIKAGDSLLYSWNTGMGGTFVGNFFNYLASPLFFVIFFFKHVDLPDAIALMILLKASFAAAFFSYYLRKSQGRNDHVNTAFGILYAFCGFFIAYYWNVMWLDAMALFPLIILGIENIIQKKGFLLYTISLTVIMISNYYMAMMVCIFSILYYLVYFLSNYNLNDKIDDKKLKFSIGNTRVLSTGITFAIASVVAALLALFALLPTIFVLRNCSATSGTFPSEMKIYYSVFDFLANHLASLEPTIRSSGDDVLPNVYCGILTVMLVPLYLLSRSIKLKEKIMHVLLLGVLYFSFNINFANYVWHGFHFPNDLPYRFSFMYSFFLLVMAFRALMRIREFTGREIMLTGIGVMGFIVMVQEIGSKNFGTNSFLISLAAVFVYTLVLAAMRNKKFQAASVALLLLCCVISESAIANTDNYSMNQTKANYSGDYEQFADAKRQLDAYHGNKMYRMELSNLRTRMDPAWYNYHGLSTFSSMASEKLSNLQSHLGMYGNYINSYTYHPQTPVYNAMMSLQYVLKKTDSNGLDNEDLYTLCVANSTYDGYVNNYCLPIAFAANNAILSWNDSDSNPFAVQADFLRRASGEANVFNTMLVDDVYCNNVNTLTEDDFMSNYVDFTKKTAGEYGSITVTVKPMEKQNCYLYVKSHSVDTVYVNGSGRDLTQGIDEAYILDIGVLDTDESVDVEIPLKDDADSGNISFYAYGIDMDVFEKGFETLEAGGLQISRFEETHIEGTVHMKDNQILFTSIPYDEGWRLTVDGKKVGKNKYKKIGDALMGFEIGAGDHTISLDFEPVAMKPAAAVSLATLLCLVLFLLIRNRKKKEYNALPVTPVPVEITQFPEDPILPEEPEEAVDEITETAEPIDQDAQETPAEAEPEEEPEGFNIIEMPEE